MITIMKYFDFYEKQLLFFYPDWNSCVKISLTEDKNSLIEIKFKVRPVTYILIVSKKFIFLTISDRLYNLFQNRIIPTFLEMNNYHPNRYLSPNHLHHLVAPFGRSFNHHRKMNRLKEKDLTN
jgi:hypothetical protein